MDFITIISTCIYIENSFNGLVLDKLTGVFRVGLDNLGVWHIRFLLLHGLMVGTMIRWSFQVLELCGPKKKARLNFV